VNNHSAEAALRPIEDSPRRLWADRFEIVCVHGVAQDFCGDECLSVFENACKNASGTPDRLQDTEAIKARSLGVNRVEPIELPPALEGAQLDGVVLAGRYTLLDHDSALQRVMLLVADHGFEFAVGGPHGRGIGRWPEL
jgi:D-threo-aldose 1-dehydrogenase